MNSVQAAACMLGMIVGSCIVAVPALAAEEEARVLILNGMDRYLVLEIDSAMRASLARETARRIVFFSEVLDAQRSPNEGFEPEFWRFWSKITTGFASTRSWRSAQRALEFFRRYGALRKDRSRCGPGIEAWDPSLWRDVAW